MKSWEKINLLTRNSEKEKGKKKNIQRWKKRK